MYRLVVHYACTGFIGYNVATNEQATDPNKGQEKKKNSVASKRTKSLKNQRSRHLMYDMNANRWSVQHH